MTLPAPRLQLRWRRPTAAELRRSSAGHFGEQKWTCDYELVLPLGEHDCRRTKKKAEMVVRLSRTFMSTGRLGNPDSAPFRDGAHAGWDSKALGGLPVYLIDPDGAATLQPNKATSLSGD
jgi:hypothetical protein